MTGFEVSTDSLRAGGGRLAEEGSSFGAAVGDFEASLGAYGAPWGSGMIASILGPAYEQVSAYIFDCLYVAAEELQLGGDDIIAMADAYDSVDDDANQSFQAILGGLG